MGYLTRIHLDEVLEAGVDGVKKGANMSVMYVDGVVTPDGTPWEPVPGPDPWDDLVVADKAYWSGGNVYEVGSTISGVSATYVGGTDQTTYRSHMQYRTHPEDNWSSSGWTTHDNVPTIINFTIPAGEEGGQVRLQSRAEDDGVDPVVKVNSFASLQQIAYADLGVVTRTNTSGLAYVNSTLTGTLAAYEGGWPPVNEEYQWQRSDTGDGGWTGITNWTSATSQSNTTLNYTTTATDLGKYVRFASKATDAEGNIAYGSGNSIGPLQAAPVMTPAVAMLNGSVADQDSPHEIPPGAHTLQMVPNQTPPDINFYWTLRSGTGTLTQDPILPDVATYTPGNGDFSPMIACTAHSDISGEASVSWSLIII